MQIQILEPDSFPKTAIARLARMAPVILGNEAADTSQIAAVFVRLAHMLDRDFHDRYPNLRWIVSPTTGLNHIDLDHFDRHGVEILSLRGRTTFLDSIRATSEHTFALLLALLRKLPAAREDVSQGNWNRYPFKGGELAGKRVLIYGYGRIGRQVAALYTAFGCRVWAHDIAAARVPEKLRCDINDALSQIDILSVHLPLDTSTKGLLDAAFLARLSPNAVIVNTARGELFDQEALFNALEEGQVAGAALDVLVGEPEPLSETLRARIVALGDRIVVTPHIGGFTRESLEMVEEFITDVFLEVANAQG